MSCFVSHGKYGLFFLLVATCVFACQGISSDNSEPTYHNHVVDPEVEPDERTVMESDLVKLDGRWLYLQNPATGLNVIDVADPDDPRPVGHLDITGQAGELYVLQNHLLVVFEQSFSACRHPTPEYGWTIATTSEVVAVQEPTSDPREVGRLCLPGQVVASRVVGEVLYLVNSYTKFEESLSWVISVDISVPANLQVLDYRIVDGLLVEAILNDRALFITQHELGRFSDPATRVRYIDISDPGGSLRERDSIVVDGQPQGRFHMDATLDTFRIVTYSPGWMHTNLFIIDTRVPDDLTVMGSYTQLASGEELWATRFDGDMVYIVTYLRMTQYPMDPLWTFSLKDPANPELLGELEVPGWSTYIFPRGDRLVAVGRGDRGARVAVSLYDVEDPKDPIELNRLEFGEPEATSEANADFRGIRILDQGTYRKRPLIVVPVTNNVWSEGGCRPQHFLQLIDLMPDDVTLRGVVDQPGRIRRTLPIEDRLYSVSDKTVMAVEVADRDQPLALAVVEVGRLEDPEECTWMEDALDLEMEMWGRNDAIRGPFMFCATLPGSDPLEGAFSWLVLLVGVTLSIRVIRRRLV